MFSRDYGGSEEQWFKWFFARLSKGQPQKIIEGVQAVFNQDNGTGRVVNMSDKAFLHAYD